MGLFGVITDILASGLYLFGSYLFGSFWVEGLSDDVGTVDTKSERAPAEAFHF